MRFKYECHMEWAQKWLARFAQVCGATGRIELPAGAGSPPSTVLTYSPTASLPGWPHWTWTEYPPTMATRASRILPVPDGMPGPLVLPVRMRLGKHGWTHSFPRRDGLRVNPEEFTSELAAATVLVADGWKP